MNESADALQADGSLADHPPMGRLPMIDPPRPFSTRIPGSLKARVEKHAAESGCQMNDVVIRALEAYLARAKQTAAVPHPRKLRK